MTYEEYMPKLPPPKRECGCQPYGKHVNECPQSKYQRNLREMLYDEPRPTDEPSPIHHTDHDAPCYACFVAGELGLDRIENQRLRYAAALERIIFMAKGAATGSPLWYCYVEADKAITEA